MSKKSNEDGPLTPSAFTPPSDHDDAPLAATGFQPLSEAPTRSSPPLGRWLATAIAVGTVLLCLFFLLTARSLEIQVNAIGEPEVHIDGIAIPLGQRYLIRPGAYQVAVTVPGYSDWQDTLTVTTADSQRLLVNPAILPGAVSFASQPPKATVRVINEQGESQILGQTPITQHSLEAGDYTLQIRAPRYQLHERRLTVNGRGIEQTVSTTLNPDWATITISTEPEDVSVLIDGEPAGTTATPVDVPSGQHQLTLRAPGYRDELIDLEVIAEVPQDLGPIVLVPASGVLKLGSEPSGANVTVDGEFAGRTPLTVELKPGREHLVQLSRAGYNRRSFTLSLARGTTDHRTLTLTPQLGEVTFEITPESAELVVNGQPRGTGSRQLSLPSVEQRIEVRLDGYATQRTRVTPRPGLAQLLTIELLTDSEARKAALTPEITSVLGQTLVLIDPLSAPVNRFDMGASRREPGRRANEVLHPVELTRGFYLATTETTNAQFRQFLGTHDSGQIEGNSLNREHQPVAGISWQQAARFCNWLSQREGLPPFYREKQGIVNGYNPSSTGYRLPTEAEWAYAARVDGDSLRRFAWGDDFPPKDKVVNVADNTSALVTGRILNGYADGYIVSAPVASFPANHRGLYDMDGNVAEWVHDVYSIPSANAEVAVDPMGPQSGDNYTVRGGSWALSRLSELRLTYRDYGAAGRDDVGFRIARYAE